MADISNENNITPLLKRVFMFLEDEEWASANEYCERILDIDPENAMAYVGKLMAELCVTTQDGLKDCAEPFNNRNNYQKALRFGDDTLKTTLEGYVEHINARNENARFENTYTDAMALINQGKYVQAIELLKNINEFKDANKLIEKCDKKIEQAKIEKETKAKHNKKVAMIVTPIVAVVLILVIVLTAHWHSYSKQIFEATCTKEGYIAYTCSCGKTYSEKTAEPRGHDYKQKITEPTCTNKGYTTYTCACGDTYIDNYLDYSHTYSAHICSKCGDIEKDYAYEYVCAWLKEHGTFDDILEKYSVRDTINNFSFSLSINKNRGGFYISLLGPNNEYIHMDINSERSSWDSNFSGYVSYGGIKNSLYFILDGFESYAPSRLHSTLKRNTEIMIENAVVCLNHYIDENIPGVDISDFGFPEMD